MNMSYRTDQDNYGWPEPDPREDYSDRSDSEESSSDYSSTSSNYSSTSSSEDSKGSSCFIATAVYGDIDAPQVRALRRFRDDVLANSKTGRSFINFYYGGAGRTIAEIIKRNLPSTIPVIRKGLDVFIESYLSKD